MLWRPLIVIIGGLLGFLWLQYSHSGQLAIGGQYYTVSVMRTEAEREKGLSGTNDLPADQAMLFAFPRDNTWGMWMKDMNYPIDMVWLDSTGAVVYAVKDAQPSSYPKIFQNVTPARYVIELPSGTIERTGISMNNHATLPQGL